MHGRDADETVLLSRGLSEPAGHTAHDLGHNNSLLSAPPETESSILYEIMNFHAGNLLTKSLFLVILVKILNFIFLAYKQGLSYLARENK